MPEPCYISSTPEYDQLKEGACGHIYGERCECGECAMCDRNPEREVEE